MRMNDIELEEAYKDIKRKQDKLVGQNLSMINDLEKVDLTLAGKVKLVELMKRNLAFIDYDIREYENNKRDLKQDIAIRNSHMESLESLHAEIKEITDQVAEAYQAGLDKLVKQVTGGSR